MSIDLKTFSIEPTRRTFDHIAAKLGPDKTPTRYQEGVFGLQPNLNFHYRPTWDPERLLYDPSRTAIVMQDFDDLLDPRQYYYGTWTMQRGRQQDTQERNFEFVEKRGLLAGLDAAWCDKLTRLVIPVRHIAWGANTNNSYIAAYGYGAPLTSAATMHMMDELGVAQYLSRIGLLLGDNEPVILDRAKQAWLAEPMWQPMRALVEETMVTRDWFELFVAQNLLIDGTVHPFIFERFDALLARQVGSAFALLSEFMVDWFAESARWVDAMLRIAAAESAANRALIERWIASWMPKVQGALLPLAEFAFESTAAEVTDGLADVLMARARKCGLAV
jgi:phenol hydroxylase P1 protein